MARHTDRACEYCGGTLGLKVCETLHRDVWPNDGDLYVFQQDVCMDCRPDLFPDLYPSDIPRCFQTKA